MTADTRHASDQDRHTTAHVRFEPLRDQIFAACGYAFVIAMLMAELLTPHRGRLTIVTGIVLAAVLIPLNLSCIRRFARLRRTLAARDSAPVDARGGEPGSKPDTPRH